MLEKRGLLRSAVREEMGLSKDDMLAVSLRSINPGKGLLLLLEAGRFLIEQPRTDPTSFRLSSEFDSMVFDGDSSVLRKLLSEDNIGKKGGNLKILVGSVGSKSNKVPYVKTRLSYLSMHSNLSKVVIWTPSTTRVASLYAAADVYVMNSQGIGETFGRVTIEPWHLDFPCSELILEEQERLLNTI